MHEPHLLVPLPAHLHSMAVDDVAEVFSPPRVVTAAQQLGMRASFSADLLTGYDLRHPDQRQRVAFHVRARQPRVLVLSPPCTLFSRLMYMNWPFAPTAERGRRLMEAVVFLEFAVLLANLQRAAGRYYVLEHPDNALSFKYNPAMRDLQKTALTARFDQCRYGLVCPVTSAPMRKLTRFLTSLPSIANCFDKSFCDGPTHKHQSVEGVVRSRHAQIYTPALCSAMCNCFVL